jgi:hypothetical protein
MVMFMGVPVAAQTVQSFDELPSVIQQLDTVEVTDVSGQKVKGQLRQLTNTTIEVFTDNTARTFDRASVQRIVLRDSVSNGTQAGALAGAIPMLVTGLLINGGCRNEGGNCLGIVIGLTGIGAAVGAGLGAAVDIASHEVVYDQGPPKTVIQGRGPRISMNVAATHASLGMSYGW